MLKELWTKIRRILGNVRYLMNSVYVGLSKKGKISLEILNSVHNKYLGERCFIIGNGPSLTSTDLDMLKNEITFGSNRIYKMFDKTNWRPNFFVMFDESVAKVDGVIEGVNSFSCDMKFVRREGYSSYKNIKSPICYIHSKYSRKYLDTPHFSDDLTKCIYTIATVTYSMIQLAVYMGFKEIYLLGMDNRYAYSITREGKIIRNEGVLSYFSEIGEKEPVPSSASATWEMDVAYEYAESYSRKHDFRIYNATRGGFLETFERVDFDTLFKKNMKK